MGLDGVELVMEVEDEFDIRIADEEAEVIRTVGDLTRTVQRKLGIEPRLSDGDSDRFCLPAAAFFRLRRAWAGRPEVAGLRLRPSTPLASLSVGFGQGRRRLWRLARRAGVRLPPLVVRAGAAEVLALVAVVGLAGFAAWVAAVSLMPVQLVLGLLVVVGVGVGWLAEALLHKSPPSIVTIGDALRACEQPCIRPAGESGLSDLELKIIKIVGEQLGYDPAIITLESRFVEDLDMD
jgi:acyl carrier protein